MDSHLAKYLTKVYKSEKIAKKKIKLSKKKTKK